MKKPGWIANALTVSRIFLSLLLLFLAPLHTAFLAVYAVCGVTDALDGFVARKTHTQSKLGARLDSLADFVLITAMAAALFPVIHLPKGAYICILFIAAIRLAAAAVSRLRHKTFAFLHTYLNKLTGFLIFLFPFLIPVFAAEISVWIVCGAAALSAVEELLIQIVSTSLNLNRKSIISNNWGKDD
jgi:CDP-diacylglycerol---glycerol-3-phosphate 3-phosphatidyltransferase